MHLVIRPERESEHARVHALHAEAFGREAEAELVDRLRAHSALTVSLVAADGEELIGHIAFSPVAVACTDGNTLAGVGLAPMAVAPSRQRGGVGIQLVRKGLAQLTREHQPFCVVLGHPRYYPRFGFVRASSRGLRWEHAAADAAFLVLELTPRSLHGIEGVVRYRSEFDSLT